MADAAIRWSSRDADIAGVSPSGSTATVQGVSEGSTQVVAESAGLTTSLLTAVSTPGNPVVHFRSNWSSGTGVSDYASYDRGSETPWTRRSSLWMSPVIAAADSAVTDAPTPYVLAVTTDGAWGSQILRVENADAYWDVPQVGESLYYRWYYSHEQPDSLNGIDDAHHPIQDGNAIGDCNWAFRTNDNRGSWSMDFNMTNNRRNPWPHNSVRLRTNLPKGVMYRFELRVHRISTDRFELYPRVFSSAGEPLYDEDDFLLSDGSPLTSNNTFLFNNPANLGGLNAGINGWSGSDMGSPVVMSYQAAFAVCSNDWCGPYTGTN